MRQKGARCTPASKTGKNLFSQLSSSILARAQWKKKVLALNHARYRANKSRTALRGPMHKLLSRTRERSDFGGNIREKKPFFLAKWREFSAIHSRFLLKVDFVLDNFGWVFHSGKLNMTKRSFWWSMHEFSCCVCLGWFEAIGVEVEKYFLPKTCVIDIVLVQGWWEWSIGSRACHLWWAHVLKAPCGAYGETVCQLAFLWRAFLDLSRSLWILAGLNCMGWR